MYRIFFIVPCNLAYGRDFCLQIWYSLGLLACEQAFASRSLDNITFKMYQDKSYLGAY